MKNMGKTIGGLSVCIIVMLLLSAALPGVWASSTDANRSLSGSDGRHDGSSGFNTTGIGNGTIWTYQIDQPASTPFQNVGPDGTIYFITYSTPSPTSNPNVYQSYLLLNALSPDGTLKWQKNYSFGQDVAIESYWDLIFSPNGAIYILTTIGEPIYSNNVIYGYDEKNLIVAVDPQNGSLEWTYGPIDFMGASDSSLSVSPNGELIFCTDSSIIALDSSGSVAWNLPLSDMLKTVHVFNASEYEKAKRDLPLEYPNGFNATLTDRNGIEHHIEFNSDDLRKLVSLNITKDSFGNLIDVDEQDVVVLRSMNITVGSEGSLSSEDDNLTCSLLAIFWCPGIGDMSIYSPQLSPYVAIAPDSTIYSMTNDGRLCAISENGTLLWNESLPINSFQSKIAIDASGNMIIETSTKKNNSIIADTLFKLLPNGTQLWYFNQTDVDLGALSMDRSSDVFVQYTNTSEGRSTSGIMCLNPNGVPLWYHEGETGQMVLSADGILYVAATHSFYALRTDGSLCWQVDVLHSSSPLTPNKYDQGTGVAISPDGTVYLSGVVCYLDSWDGYIAAIRGTPAPLNQRNQDQVVIPIICGGIMLAMVGTLYLVKRKYEGSLQ